MFRFTLVPVDSSLNILWTVSSTVAVTFIVTLTGCRESSPAANGQPPTPDESVLRERLRQTFDSMFVTGDAPVEVAKLEPVAWPDKCLGVPLPGMSCTPQTTPGYRALITVNNEMTYELRTDLPLDTVIWPAMEQVEGIITTLEPGLIIVRGEGPLFAKSEIPGYVQAAIVPGTQFLTPGGQVALGQKVRLGINAWPSSDFPVAVWVAPAD
jgi:hypothetical protein